MMNDEQPFVPPEITNDDIHWASELLSLPHGSFFGSDGNDPRQEVLKSMERIDVAACPGSGKTTLLVAKLAILASKWSYRTCGICVLSHTNTARTEIESKLGNTTIGRRLLSYPHYIGTIHGFVNEFLAIPWLRAKGYPIKIIDTAICLKKRWNKLPYKMRGNLERNNHTSAILSITSPDFNIGEVHWGKGVLGINTDTHKHLRQVCCTSCEEGYFCYDEMFVWTHDMIDKSSDVITIIRDRFPLLFIDEAQDNSEDQSTILHSIFINGNKPSICQRFGDPNQAIFNSFTDTGATTFAFPDQSIRKELRNSYRFGQTIADLADPLGAVVPYELKGLGPKEPLESGLSEGKHTIFLFDDDSISNVMKAYAELLINTFSKQELRQGNFWAIGQIHRPPENEDVKKIPHHIGHYWTDYDYELSGKEPKPQAFIQYVCAGVGKSETTGETCFAVEKISEGILRLAGIINSGFAKSHRKYNYRYVLKLLEEHVNIRKRFENLVASLVVEKIVLTKETWNNELKGIVLQIATTIAGVSQTTPDAENFLEWKNCSDDSNLAPQNKRDNIYRFEKGDKEVAIRVGSIHSIKGETHTATLVLDTFWQDRKGRHNLELLLPWLRNIRSGRNAKGVMQQSRLKVHYVAMTRPRYLLCLAMKRSSFEDGNGGLDQTALKELDNRGWDVKII